jgi:hypothetical protein
VLGWPTLSKTKNKIYSVLLSKFCGTPYTETQQKWSNKIHCQPAPASHELLAFLCSWKV